MNDAPPSARCSFTAGFREIFVCAKCNVHVLFISGARGYVHLSDCCNNIFMHCNVGEEAVDFELFEPFGKPVLPSSGVRHKMRPYVHRVSRENTKYLREKNRYLIAI